MLGAAEADFEPQAIDWCCKQLAEVGWRGVTEIEREPRQQCIE